MSSRVPCAAVPNIQHRCKVPMMQLCQQDATIVANGVPLCGTHVNHPPKQVIRPFGNIDTVEKI